MNRLLPDADGVRRALAIRGLRAGLVAGLAVLLLGLPLALLRSPVWQATASLVVLPTSTASPDVTAALYDTLSRGQVPETYAQLIRDARPADEAAAGLHLSPQDRRAVTVGVDVVSGTSVIRITGTAPRPSLAEAVADAALLSADQRIADLATPYASRPLSSARGTAVRQSLGRLTSVGLVVVVAAAVALVVAFAARALAAAGWSRWLLPRPQGRPVTPAAGGVPEGYVAAPDAGSSAASMSSPSRARRRTF